MGPTWKQQIVAYCVLLVARMFSEDPQQVQDLRTLSNNITNAKPGQSTAPIAAQAQRVAEFQVTSTPT